MSMISGAGGIVRIVDLTFRLTGIAEQSTQIQDITRRANIAVQVLTQVIMLQKLMVAGVIGGPMGWVMGAAAVLAIVPSVMNEFSDTEESNARGR